MNRLHQTIGFRFRGDSRAGRRFGRVVDRSGRVEEARRGVDAGEPARAAGDLREPVAAGDMRDV